MALCGIAVGSSSAADGAELTLNIIIRYHEYHGSELEIVAIYNRMQQSNEMEDKDSNAFIQLQFYSTLQ